MRKKRLFVDMDGTLAKWKVVEEFEVLLQKGYFLSLPPQPNMVAAIKLIAEASYGIEVFGLSAVLDEKDSKYCREEKGLWLDNAGLGEGIPAGRRIFCPCNLDKSLFVPGGIRDDDVLLDDFSKNLHEWSGRGLKCLNGVNATKGTWKGAAVSTATPAAILAAQIQQFVLAA